jgi:hypothetical protein
VADERSSSDQCFRSWSPTRRAEGNSHLPLIAPSQGLLKSPQTRRRHAQADHRRRSRNTGNRGRLDRGGALAGTGPSDNTQATAAKTSKAKGKPVPLADSDLFIEINGTDGDAGLQMLLDGEPWKSMTIRAPNGRVIMAHRTRAAFGTGG